MVSSKSNETERSIDQIDTIGELMQSMKQVRWDERGRLYSIPSQQYMRLEKDPIISQWLMSYAYDTKKRLRRGINALINFSNMSPTELSQLTREEAKRIAKECMAHLKEENLALAIDVMESSKSFFEFYDRKITFNRNERLKRTISRIKYIPQKNAEVYGIAECASATAIPRSPKWKAMILFDWQTMLRENALLSARCGALMGYTENDCPIPIKIWNGNYLHSYGKDDVYVIDRKISNYGIDYSYTFVGIDAFNAVMEYWKWREEKYQWSKKKSDLIFVNDDNHKKLRENISKQVLLSALKRGAKEVGINPEHIWVHLLRHAGKKVLIRANVDDEVREAIMCHRILGSKLNYFDYHDVEQVRKEYMKADWSRTGTHAVDKLEKKVAEQDEEIKKLKEKQTESDFDRRLKFLESILPKEHEETFGESYRNMRKRRRLP